MQIFTLKYIYFEYLMQKEKFFSRYMTKNPLGSMDKILFQVRILNYAFHEIHGNHFISSVE